MSDAASGGSQFSRCSCPPPSNLRCVDGGDIRLCGRCNAPPSPQLRCPRAAARAACRRRRAPSARHPQQHVLHRLQHDARHARAVCHCVGQVRDPALRGAPPCLRSFSTSSSASGSGRRLIRSSRPPPPRPAAGPPPCAGAPVSRAARRRLLPVHRRDVEAGRPGAGHDVLLPRQGLIVRANPQVDARYLPPLPATYSSLLPGVLGVYPATTTAGNRLRIANADPVEP
ncbi:unnamed protein product [Acanthosepion pharaonis]|uniref:Uncharacterized protein n=1 Tax=Acanthosepion pharaonis TaxID=158019 RepID=A0A812DNS1_ACAPH|nr:unnamed protein product [Sepia pharaonis]